MTQLRSLYLSFLALLVTAVVLGGCGSEDRVNSPLAGEDQQLVDNQSVATPMARGSFPLEMGSRWEYVRTFEFKIEYLNAPSPVPGEVHEAVVERTMVAQERIAGRDYAVEEAVIWIPDGNPPVKRWTRFRQDHAGLYLADVPLNWPPGATAAASRGERGEDGSGAESAIDDLMIPGWDSIAPGIEESVAELTRTALRRHTRALREIHAMLEPGSSAGVAVEMETTGRPGGLLPGELFWLPYPPHPKMTWVQRSSPFRIISEVEAHESLDLPAGRFPAYRVRIHNSLLDEDDSVVVWFGRCGRLSFDIHTETVALDIDSGEMVRITSDEVEVLTSVELAGPGRCNKRTDAD